MSSFPQDLPPRPEGRSWKERNCPGMRTCWHFSWDAYSLKTSDMAVLLRRICMWIVLALRTFLSILAIIVDAYGGRLVSMIVGIILAVIGFLFIAWCLATIGEAKGRRRVLGIMVVSKPSRQVVLSPVTDAFTRAGGTSISFYYSTPSSI